MNAERELVFWAAERTDGRHEASVPWIDELSEPVVAGTAPAAGEEVLYRTAEARDRGDTAPFVTPEDLRADKVELHVEWQPDPDRPPATADVELPILLGRSPSDLVRIWLPTAPGTCLAVSGPEDVEASLARWCREWLDAEPSRRPDRLERTAHRLEHLDWPRDGGPASGRLQRPRTLRRIGTNLTHLAADDRFDRAHGRDTLVDDLTGVLTAESEELVCLVGPHGVGKTAILETAVRQSWELMQSYRTRCDVWRVGGDQLAGGGDWRESARSMADELAVRGDVLAVESLASFARSGGADDQLAVGEWAAARFADGDFTLLTEATEPEFEAIRSRLPGLASTFRRLRVPELGRAETLDVASSWIRELERRTDVTVGPKALEAALDCADRYLGEEAFPGDVLRLLESCADVAERRRRPDIDADLVYETLALQTDLSTRVVGTETGREPREVRHSFESRVFGQDRASRTATRLVVAVEQAMTDPSRPLATLLLIGPTGVGKTETASALADEIYGSEDRLVRFDMSEFSDPAAAGRLVGSADVPEGELTSSVRVQPHSVVLFDEIEKAHRRVLDVLLRLTDEGRLTDADGRTVDFSNTVVAMTSNLGSDAQQEVDPAALRRAAEAHFRPEFFNRIDRLVPYGPLGRDALRRIARKSLGELLDRRGLRKPNVVVDIHPDLVAHLVDAAVEGDYGARSLAKRVERELVAPLARRMIEASESDDTLTRVTVVPEGSEELGLEFRRLAAAEPVDDFAREIGRPPDDAVDRNDPLGTLHRELRAWVDDFGDLADGDAMASVEEEYEQLLERVNAPQEEARTGQDLSERLRHLDVVRQRRDELVDRIRDLLGEEAPEALEFPDLDENDRAAIHRWRRLHDDLVDELVWFETQLERLAGDGTDAASLLVEGLAGPTAEYVEEIERWVRGFADRFELDLASAIRRDGTWEVGSTLDTRRSVRRLVLSAEQPGVSPVLGVLAGYHWLPTPPTRGRPALVRLRVADDGTSGSDKLADRLRGPGEDWTDPSTVEFVGRENRLEDLRLDRRQTLPGDSDEAAAEFAAELILRRISADLSPFPLEANR